MPMLVHIRCLTLFSTLSVFVRCSSVDCSQCLSLMQFLFKLFRQGRDDLE